MYRIAGHASEASSSRHVTPNGSTASTAGVGRLSSSTQASIPRSAAHASAGLPAKPKSRAGFTVAIFCALPLEGDLVDSFFTQRWPTSDYGKEPGDTNTYTLGSIGGHNVVLVHLGRMGKISAAVAAANCSGSFSGIRLAVLVGICGGVPGNMGGGAERVLGDVIISQSLWQFDFGRQYPGQFVQKQGVRDSLRGSDKKLNDFLASLKDARVSQRLVNNTWNHLGALKNSRDYHEDAAYPGAHKDNLYDPSYIHKHHDARVCPDWARTCGTPAGSCDVAKKSHCDALKCDPGKLVPRATLQQRQPSSSSSQNAPDGERPRIHMGTLASGDRVMKSGLDRDGIAKAQNVIGFEMEGAGVWDIFPTVVIKGICDYADSHKSKVWQNYAAATAASCMAAFLDELADNQ